MVEKGLNINFQIWNRREGSAGARNQNGVGGCVLLCAMVMAVDTEPNIDFEIRNRRGCGAGPVWDRYFSPSRER
jgi:hypothetical protein